MFHQLTLDDVSLDVNLGHLEEERSLPQAVLLHIKFQFATFPLACTTDNLQDTICCAALSCELQKFCDNRSFKLIETLGYQLYQFLKEKIAEATSEKVSVFLRVTKNPLFVNLRRFSFEISD
jgi:dihydroneopterin aldolase